MYKCLLEKKKYKDFYTIKPVKNTITPNGFLSLLLTRFMEKYFVYNVNDWYCDYDGWLPNYNVDTSFKIINTNQGKIGYQKVESIIFQNIVFSDEQIENMFLLESQNRFKNVKFEEFKERFYSEKYQTVFITKI
ncbi:MAG: hypothetical protein WCR30_04355 [Clostridia bacterium]